MPMPLREATTPSRGSTEQRGAPAVAAGQKEALELAVSGAPIDAVLNVLVRTAKEQSGHGTGAAVFIVDAETACLRIGAAAGMSEDCAEAIDRLGIGPHAPSCDMAAYTGRTVIVRDVAQDPLWAPYRHLAQEHGIRACWSYPIRTSAGKVLGTFALYHRSPREPEPGDIEPVAILAHTAAVVIERHQEAEERKRAEEALRENEERLTSELAAMQQLQDIGSLLIQEGDVDALYRRIVDAAVALMRSDAASMQMHHHGRGELRLLAWTGFHPEAAAFWKWVPLGSGSTCGTALSSGERVVVPDVETCDFMAGTADLDAYRRSDIRAVQSTPLVSRSGRLLGMISTHWRKPHRPAQGDLRLLDVLARQAADLIERTQAEARLRETTARLRHIIDSAKEYAIITLDSGGRIASWNSGAERLLGYDESEAVGRSGDIFFTPEDRAAGVPEWEMQTARDEGRAANERWHMRKDGSRFWGSGVMLPVEGAEPSAYLKIFRDRTSERLAEERQNLLLGELNHRVKNTLATVQSIASQTLRSNDVEAGVRESFEARLMALAKGHDLLTKENWEGAELHAIVSTGLEPFQAVEEDRLHIDGPILYVGPEAALALTMGLHELATNATKYGALSNESGRISVTWAVDGSETPQLRFRWQEYGGPPVTPPHRKGFGSRLIERSLADGLGGEVRLDYAPDGVVCTIDAPLSNLRGGR